MKQIHRKSDARADDEVDLVFGHKAACVGGAFAGVGGVIEHDEVDFFAANGFGKQLELVLHRDAQARAGAGQGQADADVDVGQCCCAQERGNGGGDEAGFECHGGLLVL
jgi:hypothetical protein